MTDLVAAARAEAARLGHDYIGSEHLFLALLGSGDPSLGTILTSFNLDPAVVRERIERRAPKGRGAPLAEGDAALRSGAKRALEASAVGWKPASRLVAGWQRPGSIDNAGPRGAGREAPCCAAVGRSATLP